MKPTEMFPMMSAETPKPIMSTPEENPTLSGNHWLVVAAMVLYPMPTPVPAHTP